MNLENVNHGINISTKFRFDWLSFIVVMFIRNVNKMNCVLINKVITFWNNIRH